MLRTSWVIFTNLIFLSINPDFLIRKPEQNKMKISVFKNTLKVLTFSIVASSLMLISNYNVFAIDTVTVTVYSVSGKGVCQQIITCSADKIINSVDAYGKTTKTTTVNTTTGIYDPNEKNYAQCGGVILSKNKALTLPKESAFFVSESIGFVDVPFYEDEGIKYYITTPADVSYSSVTEWKSALGL